MTPSESAALRLTPNSAGHVLSSSPHHAASQRSASEPDSLRMIASPSASHAACKPRSCPGIVPRLMNASGVHTHAAQSTILHHLFTVPWPMRLQLCFSGVLPLALQATGQRLLHAPNTSFMTRHSSRSSGVDASPVHASPYGPARQTQSNSVPGRAVG